LGFYAGSIGVAFLPASRKGAYLPFGAYLPYPVILPIRDIEVSGLVKRKTCRPVKLGFYAGPVGVACLPASREDSMASSLFIIIMLLFLLLFLYITIVQKISKTSCFFIPSTIIA
jgi:hypothetical protein